MVLHPPLLWLPLPLPLLPISCLGVRQWQWWTLPLRLSLPRLSIISDDSLRSPPAPATV